MEMEMENLTRVTWKHSDDTNAALMPPIGSRQDGRGADLELEI